MNTIDQLITTVGMPRFDPKIKYHDPIAMFGSCFAEHISQKLDRYKYSVLTNPFGILYNPVSIARSIERIVLQQYYQTDELVLQDNLYHSMDHHGLHSGENSEVVVSKINASMKQAYEHLSNCGFVFISPGTSKVYTYKPSGAIVGNCHKIPQSSFTYKQLTTKECEEAFETIYTCIKKISPAARIIWTVSPVRHLRDGLIESQRSKSSLIVAVDQFLKRHPTSGYFPAYEIMMDQLRDYRYYARDMVHPSEVAIDIIWDLFSETYLDTHERAYHPAIEKIKKAMEHRFLHDHRENIKTFATGQLKNIDNLATLLPDLNWQKERQYFFHELEMD